MTYEKSCGAVVYTKAGGDIRYVLIQQTEGFWGFPKGHMEENETEEQTALREIEEEVHLKVSILPGFRTTDEYRLPNKPEVIKQVVFFCAEYDSQTMIAQQEEVSQTSLAPYDEAMRLLTYESTKRVLREAHRFLLSR